jgi:hypothetical protein
MQRTAKVLALITDLGCCRCLVIWAQLALFVCERAGGCFHLEFLEVALTLGLCGLGATFSSLSTVSHTQSKNPSSATLERLILQEQLAVHDACMASVRRSIRC